MKKEHQKSERAKRSIFQKIAITIISIIILAFQIMLYYFLMKDVRAIPFINLTVRIIGLICVVSLFSINMCSSYKLIWSIIILIFPFAGTLFYLLLGNQRSFPKRKFRKIHKYLDQYLPKNDYLQYYKGLDNVGYKHAKIIENATGFPAYTNTLVTFYNEINSKYQEMLADMKQAEKYIFMEYFIISSGKMLDEIIEVLQEKGSQGVEIKICYDTIGTKNTLKRKDFIRLEAIPNLRISKYEPLGLTFNPAVNYRDHRKMTIIDGKIAYVGGDNIADEYANFKKRFGYWRDNAVKLRGEAVETCVYLFAETWYMSTKETIHIFDYVSKYSVPETSNLVIPYGDGPTDPRNPAYDLYCSFAANAKDYLYISTPYLIIDDEFINNLVLAARSGVDVRILVPGIPDKKIIYSITSGHYGELLKAGVKIYRYSPGFTHAKNYICDDKYATVGSVNVDYRSLYLHFENGVLLINDPSVNELKHDFLAALDQSEEITYKMWCKRSWSTKIWQLILKVFSPLV